MKVKAAKHRSSQGSDFKNPVIERRERRKEKRLLKKAKRLAYNQRIEMPTVSKREAERKAAVAAEKRRNKRKRRKMNVIKKKIEERKERKQERLEKKLEEQGQKLAIAKEDRELRDLEKKLKLKKKNSLPQAFIGDGLDYIFEALDGRATGENPDDLDLGSESDLENLDEEIRSDSEIESSEKSEEDKSEDENDNLDDSDEDMEVVSSSSKKQTASVLNKSLEKTNSKRVVSERLPVDDSDSEIDSDDAQVDLSSHASDSEGSEVDRRKVKKLKVSSSKQSEVRTIVKDESKNLGEKECVKSKLKQSDEERSEDQNSEEGSLDEDEESLNEDEEMSEVGDSDDDKSSSDSEELREDIYGRTINKDGAVVTTKQTTGTYVPPAKRAMMSELSGKKKLELERLKKQLKGLINRASEANIQPISSQIEDLYMSHSRGDINELLAGLLIDACVTPILTPERLCLELAMLVAILHGNVGTEVGAHFLQILAKKFESKFESTTNPESKEMHNIVVVLACLYNFKIVHSSLLFDVTQRLLTRFKERDIELIVLLLKNAGFSLRKDDPTGLKELILKIQTAANAVDTSGFEDQSRVRFMLDILLAIKNNNMRKIPNYDPDHLEHLRKLIRNYIKDGSFGRNQLNIKLEDLVSADERGRWWVVGSAWEGRGGGYSTQAAPQNSSPRVSLPSGVTTQLQELARKQRMNTDIRKTIFFTIMTSEDYVDAFEKLLKLGLKHQQEREIIHVMLDCCLQEQTYNPFYAFLTQKFCDLDRRFQMTVQFSMWDKFKEIGSITQQNRDHLAALLTYLLLKKGLSLSVLKVVEFGSLEKPMVRFLKSLLASLLLTPDEKEMKGVFERIAPLDGLRHLQDGLKVFMKHFLSKGVEKLDCDVTEFKHRMKIAEKSLSLGQNSFLL